MLSGINLKNISDPEEKANAISHAFGTILFIVCSIALMIKARNNSDTSGIFSAIIYGGSLVLLYASSTVYHAFYHTTWKPALKLIDHASIFILIAGTYTPFLLVGLIDHIHISFIISMWTIAFLGIIYKIFAIRKHKIISTLIYLAMGWMAIFKIDIFYKYLPIQASVWILIGGLFYSFGTYFYSKEKMKYHHAIWHIFVLCGSISHFIAIYFYVY